MLNGNGRHYKLHRWSAEDWAVCIAHRNYREVFDGCEWMSVGGYWYVGMHAAAVCIGGLVGRWRFGVGLVQASRL